MSFLRGMPRTEEEEELGNKVHDDLVRCLLVIVG